MNDRPIDPIQAMMDGMSAAWQKERSQTQMTLGAFIKALESVDPERRVAGVGEPHSYRGYYSDLSFEPSGDATVKDALALARSCMGKAFEGWKGGDFQMGEATPIWSAHQGSGGPRIMGVNLKSDPITLIVAEEDDA